MINILLQGGLGNQLFQIFTLIAFSLKYHKPFFFYNSSYVSCNKRNTYWNNFLSNLKPFLREEDQKQLIQNAFVFREKTFCYDSTIESNNIYNNILFIGYFQSYLYFENYRNSIIKLLKINEKKEIVKKKFNNDYNFSNTISIHFRLGDYKELNDYHPIIHNNYYKNALKYLIEKIDNKKIDVLYFYELSDYEDIEIRINELKQVYNNINFIDGTNSLEDWEQLLLMSLCKYNIIANSTFSWWGAYLNENINNIVCYPSVWFGKNLSNYKTNDLFKLNWIKIDFDYNNNL